MAKKKQVTWVRSDFGLAANFEIPLGTNVIVLATNGGADKQLTPRQVLLQHQVYKKDLTALLRETGATEVYAIPYDSDAVIRLNPK